MTTLSPPTTVVPTRPHPRRYRWLFRGIVAVLGTVAVLGLIRVWWGHVATARLDQAVAAAHARGEPATIDDFNDKVDPVAGDDGNAADLIRRAAAGVTYTTAESQWDANWMASAPLTAADRSTLAGIVASNAVPLQQARKAIDVPTVNWGVRFTHPVIRFAMPFLNRQRELANLLRQSFVSAHDAGDDATAVADLRAIVREADAMSTDTPLLVTHLVAVGIDSLGSQVAADHAAELRVEQPQTRAAVVALIRQLLDDTAYTAGGRREAFGERMCLLDIAQDPHLAMSIMAPGTGGGPIPALMWAIQPMTGLAVARAFPDATAAAAAYAQPTLPAARAVLPPVPGTTGSGLDEMETWVLKFYGSFNSRALDTHFRGLTQRRTAAVLLALRLYAADHHGQLPGTLAELVPAYLPAVPVDPMSPDAHPLRYAAARTRVYGVGVYSVGVNGVDDGGSTTPTGKTWGGQPPGPWEMMDAVYPYSTVPATQPATQPTVTPGS